MWDAWIFLGPPVSAWIIGLAVASAFRIGAEPSAILRFFSVGLLLAAAAVVAADTLTGHALGAVITGFVAGSIVVIGVTQIFARSGQRTIVLLVLELIILGALIAAWHSGQGKQAFVVIGAVSVRMLAMSSATVLSTSASTLLTCPVLFALASTVILPLMKHQQHATNDLMLAALVASAFLFAVEEFVAPRFGTNSKWRSVALISGLITGALLHFLGHRIAIDSPGQAVCCKEKVSGRYSAALPWEHAISLRVVPPPAS